MKILFTKSGIEKEVSDALEKDSSCIFKDFIEIENLEVPPFNVNEKTLLFTSRNGVRSFIKNNFEFAGNQIVSVGRKTYDLLKELGQKSINFENSAKAGKWLAENLKNQEILHFCSDIAQVILAGENKVMRLEVYKTTPLYPKIEEDFDAVCFFSPSGVRSFAKFNSFDDRKIFSIGETTTAELRKFTEEKIYTSVRNTLGDLLGIVKFNTKLHD